MKARNFALTLIAASAMFAFACDDGDSKSCDSKVDKAECVDGGMIKVCIGNAWIESKCATAAPMCKLGACVIDDTIACTPGAVQCLDGTKLGTCNAEKKWTPEVCEFGCDTVKKACKPKPVEAKCTVNETKCVNNALEICVVGADKKIQACSTGCVDGSKACSAAVTCTATETKCVKNALEVCVKGSDKKIEVCADGCLDGAVACTISTKCKINETKCVNNALEICVAGAEKKIEACADGCVDGAEVCKVSTTCKVTETKCFNNALEICVIGAEKKIEACSTGCVNDASSCNAAVTCVETNTVCVNNALEVCVLGKDKKIEACTYGCKVDAKVCNEKPVEAGFMCDPALEATYKIGDAQPTPVYKWCCSNTDSKKAWTSKDGKITQWDCAAGCKESTTKPGDMYCDKGEVPAGDFMCDPALEATYKVGNPQPTPVYKWCCSNTDTKKAWTSAAGLITQWDCAGGCKEDPKEAGKMFCDKGVIVDPKACAKAEPAKSAVAGAACDPALVDGTCLNSNTWIYCSKDSKFAISYCAGDCAFDHTKTCGFSKCSYTGDNSDSTTACTKEAYAGRCAPDKKSGSFCTSSIVRTTTCKAGYECKLDDGRVGCGPAL